MFLPMHNLVRMTMPEAARRQEVTVERISFVDALRWLANAVVGQWSRTSPSRIVAGNDAQGH